jgi:hypothetical protein
VEGVHEVVLAGEATLDRLLELLRSVDALAAGEPTMRVLVDESALTPGGLDVDSLRRIAAEWQVLRHVGRVRIAVVAPSDVVFGLNRQTIALADAGAVKQVFRTRGEAEAWLDDRG